MIKYMAVAVAVAVSGVVAVPVAGLTKRFFDHPKRFLNQCLGLLYFAPKCTLEKLSALRTNDGECSCDKHTEIS